MRPRPRPRPEAATRAPQQSPAGAGLPQKEAEPATVPQAEPRPSLPRSAQVPGRTKTGRDSPRVQVPDPASGWTVGTEHTATPPQGDVAGPRRLQGHLHLPCSKPEDDPGASKPNSPASTCGSSKSSPSSGPGWHNGEPAVALEPDHLIPVLALHVCLCDLRPVPHLLCALPQMRMNGAFSKGGIQGIELPGLASHQPCGSNLCWGRVPRRRLQGQELAVLVVGCGQMTPGGLERPWSVMAITVVPWVHGGVGGQRRPPEVPGPTDAQFPGVVPTRILSATTNHLQMTSTPTQREGLLDSIL